MEADDADRVRANLALNGFSFGASALTHPNRI